MKHRFCITLLAGISMTLTSTPALAAPDICNSPPTTLPCPTLLNVGPNLAPDTALAIDVTYNIYAFHTEALADAGLEIENLLQPGQAPRVRLRPTTSRSANSTSLLQEMGAATSVEGLSVEDLATRLAADSSRGHPFVTITTSRMSILSGSEETIESSVGPATQILRLSPELMQSGRIRLDLNLVQTPTGSHDRSAPRHVMSSVVVSDGEPFVISELGDSQHQTLYAVLVARLAPKD